MVAWKAQLHYAVHPHGSPERCHLPGADCDGKDEKGYSAKKMPRKKESSVVFLLGNIPPFGCPLVSHDERLNR